MSITVKGTAFSTDAVTNDVFFRTDLDSWYEYNGTLWLSSGLEPFSRQIENASATSTQRKRLAADSDSLYIATAIETTTFVSTTNDSDNYWSVTVAMTDSGFINDTDLQSFTTEADTADTMTNHDSAPAITTPSVSAGIDLTVTKTGSPGNIYVWTAFGYKRIAS